MIKKINFIYITILILLAFSSSMARSGSNQAASIKYLITKKAQVFKFLNYEPKSLHSIYELPSIIRNKLINYMKDRFGKKMYNEIKYEKGIIIEKNQYKRLEEFRSYTHQEFIYEIVFSISLKAKGIEKYEFTIRLDKNGTIIKETDFPDFSVKNIKFSDIISTDKAISIAYKAGLPQNLKKEISISYNKKNNTLVYTVKALIKKSRYMPCYQAVDIDAFTGKILKIYKKYKL